MEVLLCHDSHFRHFKCTPSELTFQQYTGNSRVAELVVRYLPYCATSTISMPFILLNIGLILAVIGITRWQQCPYGILPSFPAQEMTLPTSFLIEKRHCLSLNTIIFTVNCLDKKPLFSNSDIISIIFPQFFPFTTFWSFLLVCREHFSYILLFPLVFFLIKRMFFWFRKCCIFYYKKYPWNPLVVDFRQIKYDIL